MKLLAFHAHAGDPLSMLIKALTRSCYCHAAVLIDNAKWKAAWIQKYKIVGQGNLIVEEFFPHVRVRYLAPTELAEIDVFSVLGLTAKMEDKGMKWCMDQLDARTAYGITDLFKFLPGPRALLGEDNDQSFEKHSICSQFAFNAVRMGGLRLLNCHDYEVSPDKLQWSPFAIPEPKLK